jgi:tetratricopeptide (TPR) repeat protein
MGLEEQAEPIFLKILQIHPNNETAHLGLAEIDRALGFLDRSAQHYEKALETMGKHAWAWRDYAETLLEQRDYKTAELAIRQALQISTNTDSLVVLAIIQRGGGKLKEALETLAGVLAQKPERLDLLLMRGLWLVEDGRLEAALGDAEAVLKNSPVDPLALWLRARVLIQTGQRNQARKDLEAASQLSRQAPFVAKASETFLSLLKQEKSRASH